MKTITLPYVPHGLEAIRQYYGNPDANGDGEPDPAFAAYLVKRPLPFPMRIPWLPGQAARNAYAHRIVIDSMIGALEEIRDYRGYEYLRQNGFDWTGGIYAFRPKTGGGGLTTHAWGIAIDLNPHLGRYGHPSVMPDFIIAAFEKRGWIWGGRWSIPDGMHFQAASGY